MPEYAPCAVPAPMSLLSYSQDTKKLLLHSLKTHQAAGDKAAPKTTENYWDMGKTALLIHLIFSKER